MEAAAVAAEMEAADMAAFQNAVLLALRDKGTFNLNNAHWVNLYNNCGGDATNVVGLTRMELTSPPFVPALANRLIAAFAPVASLTGPSSLYLPTAPAVEGNDTLCEQLLRECPLMPQTMAEYEALLGSGVLPVDTHFFSLLTNEGRDQALRHVKHCPGSLFATELCVPMYTYRNPTGLSKEMLGQDATRPFCILVWRTLEEFAPSNMLVSLTVNKNSSVKGASATVIEASLRPDLTAVGDFLLLGGDEEQLKSRGGHLQAEADLRRKFHHGLDEVHYGNVPFIPVMTVEEDSIRYGMVHADGQVEFSANLHFNLNNNKGRVSAALAAVNVYRLFRRILAEAPPLSIRGAFPYYVPTERPTTTANVKVTIEPQPGCVVKTIRNAPAFFAAFGHSLEAVQAAYRVANSSQHMVSSQAAPDVTGKDKTYRVVLTKVGRPRLVNDLTEADVRQAAWTGLQALQALNNNTYTITQRVKRRRKEVATSRPLVFKDMRFENVLWRAGVPFIADLEQADWADQQVVHNNFAEWTLETCEDQGDVKIYTHKSDVYQVGRMINLYIEHGHFLTQGGHDFMRLLLAHDLTAQEALAKMDATWP